MEQHLEDFLVQNWGQTELGTGYDIFEEDGEVRILPGASNTPVEYRWYGVYWQWRHGRKDSRRPVPGGRTPGTVPRLSP